MAEPKAATQAATDARSGNLYQKLAAISGEIGAISKDGRNSEQKFDFIEYAAVAGKLRTLFAKYGVVVVPRMQQAHKQQREDIKSKYGARGQAVLVDMTFTVINADKPDDKFTVPWTGEAVDYGDKATNKAATSALKYYLMRQFNVSEKGEDNDAEAPDRGHVETAPPPRINVPKPAVEKVTAAQLADMFATMKGKGYSDRDEAEDILHNIADVASLTDLTRADANKLIEQLKDEAVDKAMLDTLKTPAEAA